MDSMAKEYNHSAKTIKWFNKEEFFWRSLASGIWLVMLLPVFLSFFVFISNCALLSPLTWVLGVFSELFSIYFIFTYTILTAASLISVVGQSRSLDVCKANHGTTFKLLIYLLRPKQMVNISCVSFSAFVITLCLIKLSFNVSSIWSDQRCGFMLPLSVLLGLMYAIDYHKKHEYVVQFPIIQQKRLFRIKKVIYPCLVESILTTLKVMRLYYIIYLLAGITPMLISRFVLASDESFSIWSFVLQLFSFRLFWSCFCVSVFTTFILRLSNELLKIFNTQMYVFPLKVTLENEGKILSDAMTSPSLFLKYLGYHDYSSLSRLSGGRRRMFFELSPPGNQAHLWNTTSAECLRVLQDLRTNLISMYEQKNIQKFPLHLSSPPPKTIGVGNLFSPNLTELAESAKNRNSPGRLSANNTSTIYSPVNQSNQSKALNLLLETEEELFNDLQIVLWCIEGLTNLVAASFTEDKYGVVQRKLSDIITELLLLLEACDMYSKVSLTPTSIISSRSNVETSQHNATQAASLKIALKIGLYQITTTFGNHMSAIRLSRDQKKRLHGFLDFAE